MLRKALFAAFVIAGSVVSFQMGRGDVVPTVTATPAAYACMPEEQARDPWCWCGCCMLCPYPGCGGCS